MTRVQVVKRGSHFLMKLVCIPKFYKGEKPFDIALCNGQTANFVRAHWLWRHIAYPGGRVPSDDRSPHPSPRSPADGGPNSPYDGVDSPYGGKSGGKGARKAVSAEE